MLNKLFKIYLSTRSVNDYWRVSNVNQVSHTPFRALTWKDIIVDFTANMKQIGVIDISAIHGILELCLSLSWNDC
jgi:hypothetical protein